MLVDALSQHDTKRVKDLHRQLPKPDLSVLPGDNGLPLIGHTLGFTTNLHGYLNSQYKKHGPVFRLHTILHDAVILLGPEANQLVFKNENQLFSNYLAWDTVFARIFDNNLLERDFANHKHHRKILQTAFKRPSIEAHIDMMNPLIRQGISAWKPGESIKVLDQVKKLLLNIGATVFLGMEIGKEADKINQAFVDTVAATSDPLRLNIPFSPFAKGIQGRKTLSTFIFHNIDRKRLKTGRDIFSQICHLTDDNGKAFSDGTIRDHIIFLLFAAHDTTTSALCSTLYALASQPDWQDTLREEMFALNTDTLTFDNLEFLEKTAWTFKEALRMYPPLCIMPRQSLKPFEFQGHSIPANTIVSVSPLFTHYMEDYWSNPTQFDALRFSPDRQEEKKHFYQYVPFGGGAHKCLGLHFAEVQGKMFLFNLLKKFRVSIKRDTPYRYSNVPLTFPSNGLPLKLTRL